MSIRKVIVFGLILFFPLVLLAQQRLLNEIDNRIVYEKLDSITKQARVKSYDIKPKKKRWYYWYWKNTIQKNYGGFEGSLLDGAYIVFDKNENLLEKAMFEKGVIVGKYLYWNTEGFLIKEEKWKKGIKTGKYKLYNNKGNLLEEGRNREGKKHGIVHKFINGKIVNTLHYKKGKKIKDKKELNLQKEERYIEKQQKRAESKKQTNNKSSKKVRK